MYGPQYPWGYPPPQQQQEDPFTYIARTRAALKQFEEDLKDSKAKEKKPRMDGLTKGEVFWAMMALSIPIGFTQAFIFLQVALSLYHMAQPLIK